MKTGEMFLREGVVLPKSVPLETTNYSQGWRTVDGHDNFTLDRKLRSAGWGLLFMAGEVKSISVGPHGDSSMRRTIQSVLSKIHAQNFNCASVASVSDRRFLGIPYTIVSGYAYNLQHGSQLNSLAERQRRDIEQDRASKRSPNS
jgi:hypothetical protein